MSTAEAIIEQAVSGMGYEPVDIERAQQGLLRVYIDSPAGITIDDCEKVSRQLSHLLAVEDIDYARLEISSPGLDRPLKKSADFERFAGARATVRLRVPFQGQRNFEGLVTVEEAGRFGLELIEPEPAPARPGGRKGPVRAGAGKQRKAGRKPSGPEAGAAAGGAAPEGILAADAAVGQAVPADGARPGPQPVRKLVFSLDEIDRARLVPEYRF